jgi:hypothetical protein
MPIAHFENKKIETESQIYLILSIPYSLLVYLYNEIQIGPLKSQQS